MRGLSISSKIILLSLTLSTRKCSIFALLLENSDFIIYISGSRSFKSPVSLLKTSLNLHTLPDKFLNWEAFRFPGHFFVSNKKIFSAGIFTPCNKVDVVIIYLISLISEKAFSTYKRTFSGIPP